MKMTEASTGVRTFEIITPDGKYITVIEKLDPHVEWFNLLKSRLTPEGIARLKAFFAEKSAKELYEEFGGNIEVAVARLSGSNLPNDLLAVRTTLRPEAQRAFDYRWHTIARGSRNPTKGQVDSFKSYLDNLKAKSGGNLNAALEAEAAKIPAGTTIPRPIGTQYPKDWSLFDPARHEAFRVRLEDFRGNENLESDFKGGEGAIFTGKSKSTALKRWFSDSSGNLDKMDLSLQKLRAAREAVGANPELAGHVDVVAVHERTGDYIVRDFDPSSKPLSQSPAGEASQEAAIEAILKSKSRSATEQDILNKLQNKSDNLHWSPSRKKILIIDMQ